MRSSFTGPLLIALAAFLWGIDGILRRSLYGLPPITIVLLEHVIGLLVLLPFFLPHLKKERFTRKEWMAMAFVGLLSSVLGTLWFTTALLKTNYIPFSVVFLLQKLQPVFAIAGAAIVLKEKVTRKYILWAALAIAAAYFVTFPGGRVNISSGSGTIIAAVFATLAAFAWGFTTPFSRYTLLNHSSTAVTGWRFMFAVFFAGLLIPFLHAGSSLAAITYPQVLRLILIAISTGMVALWIYYRGLKFTRASIATIVELIFPLTAVLIDIFLYKTVLSWSQYLAGAVLIYATWRVSKLNTAA